MEQMNFFGCEAALRSRVITKQTQRESHEKVDKQVIRNNILNELSYGNMTAREIALALDTSSLQPFVSQYLEYIRNKSPAKMAA